MAASALVASALILPGCAVHSVRAPSALALRGPVEGPRHLFVFLDGTKNDDRSGTNVWRLYQLVTANGNPATRSFYVEGVGSATHPLTGMILGVGMEWRIRAAYRFLAENFRPDDRIYIFGFSRGALEARALAGVLAYAGLPVLPRDRHDNAVIPAGFKREVNRMVGRLKGSTDKQSVDAWKKWEPTQGPLAHLEMRERSGTTIPMRLAEVAFLGVWDTVPGSLFKEIDGCKLVSKNGSSSRDRYKSGSYPSVRVIAQAISSDEKRDRFAVLPLCEALNPERTQVYQARFPGAHSDVGGGYADAIDFGAGPPLSNLSFNWMTRLLSQSYPYAIAPAPLPENPDAIAHWSVGDFPGNFRSKCEDRSWKGFPGGAPIAEDASVASRQREACLRIKGTARPAPYPLNCHDASEWLKRDGEGQSTAKEDCHP